MAVGLKRFDIHLVSLDPTIGTEIQKTRPCLVISPDEMNAHLRTVIVAPMTTSRHDYPMRVSCRFQGKDAEVVLDQIRAVDRARLYSGPRRAAGDVCSLARIPRQVGVGNQVLDAKRSSDTGHSDLAVRAAIAPSRASDLPVSSDDFVEGSFPEPDADSDSGTRFGGGRALGGS